MDHNSETTDDFDSSLCTKLHLAAAEFSPDVNVAFDSLGVSSRSRRRRRGLAITTAAASLALAIGAAFAFTIADTPMTQVDAAGQGVSGPSEYSKPTAPELDATLVLVRHPFAVDDGFPLMALLRTPTRAYLSDSLADGTTPDQVRFDPNGPQEYGYGDIWTMVDKIDTTHPDVAVASILEQRSSGIPNEPDVPAGSEFFPLNKNEEAAAELMFLISTGVGTPEQVKTLVVLLHTIEGVEVSSVDGLGVVRSLNSGTLFYMPDTGRPVRWEWDGSPEATMEYVAVERVESRRFLDQNVPTSTPQTSTTVIDGPR